MHFNLGTGVFVSGLMLFIYRWTATGDAATASSSSSPLSFMFCCVSSCCYLVSDRCEVESYFLKFYVLVC